MLFPPYRWEGDAWVPGGSVLGEARAASRVPAGSVGAWPLANLAGPWGEPWDRGQARPRGPVGDRPWRGSLRGAVGARRAAQLSGGAPVTVSR